MEKKTEAKVNVARTPQGQVVAEMPRTTAPVMQHNVFGVWTFWLGDPMQRYGRLAPSTAVPLSVKVMMLKDPVLAMCAGFTGATLAKATREIHCKDEAKRRFFEAMVAEWQREFILQANVGIALGSIGLIKRWKFETPQPTAVDDPPVWTGAATPFVVTGFDQIHPLTSEPRFDKTRRHFEGIGAGDELIDVFYALWLTFRKEFAFGDYRGAGRLDNAYKDWWHAQFGQDLYLVAQQKESDRVVMVTYPPGEDPESRKDFQTIALEVGDNVRSGATVALPSSVYPSVNDLGDEDGLTNVRKWSLEFLEGSGSLSRFHEIDDHHAQRMALGYLLPPQTFMNVKQSALGGPTTADVLADVAQDLLMLDAQDIDRHINEYVFPAVSRANFPPDSPPVTMRTVGLPDDNREQLMEIVRILTQKGEEPGQIFDMREAMERLEFPTRSEAQVEEDAEEETPTQTPPGQVPEGEGEGEATMAIASQAGDTQVVGEPLPKWPADQDVSVDAVDVAAALMDWEVRAPEVARGLIVALTTTEQKEG